jgi:signal transduction histidine kinase
MMPELQESHRAHRAFLAHLRHELRTPINAIIGYGEMLLEDAAERGQENVVSDLQKIRAAGGELLALVNDILAQDKIESGTLDGDLESFSVRLRHDLLTPINAVIGYSEMLLEDAAAQGAEDFIPDLQKIHAAAQRFLTLISDVVALSRVRGGAMSLDLMARSDASEMIQDVVTTIRPLAEGETRASEQGLILIVDDNEINRDLLSRRLERQGYTVAVADSGHRALEMLAAEKFDLVLLDILMPEMNGYQVLERLKADERLRHIPVIMLSSLDELDSIVRCIEMGAEDYLSKPFNPVLLRARIDASLEKKRLRDREVYLFEQLQENYKRLQELESLRDSLTQMIIHDLRTPLTSLMTGLQTMALLGELSEMQNEMLDMAIRGGQTLLGMINDLLDISKMEDGSLRLDYSDVVPAEVVNHAVQQVASLARDKNLTLAIHLAPDLPPLPADEDKLRRTLVNLLGNAVKFTPEEGTITVSTSLIQADSISQFPAVLFSVADTGEGIPKEAFERIFEKFGQVETRKSGRKMSTGLGLTFCKMAVEAHGGRIWVESELGKGSVFSFVIPCVKRGSQN